MQDTSNKIQQAKLLTKKGIVWRECAYLNCNKKFVANRPFQIYCCTNHGQYQYQINKFGSLEAYYKHTYDKFGKTWWKKHPTQWKKHTKKWRQNNKEHLKIKHEEFAIKHFGSLKNRIDFYFGEGGQYARQTKRMDRAKR